MDPCNFAAGSYNVNATVSGGNTNYTLTASVRNSVSPLQQLTLATPYMDLLGPYQYQFYSVDMGSSNGTQSGTITVTPTCGQLDIFIN